MLSKRENGNVSMSVSVAIFKGLSADGKKADQLFAIQKMRTSRKVGNGDGECATDSIAAKEIFFALAADAAELAGVSMRTDEDRAAAKVMFEKSLTWKVGDVTVVASPDDGNPNRVEPTLMIKPPTYPVAPKKEKKEANTVVAIVDF